MATEAQVAANRINGLKGGVKTEEGKAISRLNARKHGIFASVMTEHDASELSGIEAKLAEELRPVGTVEEILVEKIAATCLRLQRCGRMEQEHYATRCETSLPGIRAACERKLDWVGRHDVRLTNQFLRLLREVEHRQKERRSADCSLPAVARALRSAAASAGEEELATAGAQNAECRRTATTNETPDSRPPDERRASLRGNDNEGMKNEPNSGADAPESNLAARQRTGR